MNVQVTITEEEYDEFREWRKVRFKSDEWEAFQKWKAAGVELNVASFKARMNSVLNDYVRRNFPDDSLLDPYVRDHYQGARVLVQSMLGVIEEFGGTKA